MIIHGEQLFNPKLKREVAYDRRRQFTKDGNCRVTLTKERHGADSRLYRGMRRDYSVLEDKMELSSSDVIRLLGISRASLARWRDTNAIPFRYISCNHVAYPFKGLYVAIKSGRASFKGFRRVEALQRLNAYKDGVLKGYMGDGQTLFEEL